MDLARWTEPSADPRLERAHAGLREAGSCTQQTQEAIGQGYRYLCGQHREPLAEELREKQEGMSSADLV